MKYHLPPENRHSPKVPKCTREVSHTKVTISKEEVLKDHAAPFCIALGLSMTVKFLQTNSLAKPQRGVFYQPRYVAGKVISVSCRSNIDPDSSTWIIYL